MRRVSKKHFLSLLIMAGLGPACSNSSFSNLEKDGAAAQINGGNACTSLVNQTLPIKVILVVDTSGSNADQVNSYGTDHYKNLRGGSIQTFFDKYRTHGNFSWGFVVFQDSSAYSLISTGFSNQPADMQNAIRAFYNISDGGGTPYRPALARARQMIQNDGSGEDTKYIVVFISDGLPDPAVSNSTLRSDIQALLAARPGKVSLSAIYYGHINDQAAERLAMMANYGEGGFLDANTSYGQTFSIESVIQIPGTCAP